MHGLNWDLLCGRLSLGGPFKPLNGTFWRVLCKDIHMCTARLRAYTLYCWTPWTCVQICWVVVLFQNIRPKFAQVAQTLCFIFPWLSFFRREKECYAEPEMNEWNNIYVFFCTINLWCLVLIMWHCATRLYMIYIAGGFFTSKQTTFAFSHSGVSFQSDGEWGREAQSKHII